MAWDVHITETCQKISRSVGIISLLRHYINQETLLSVYSVLISLYIYYGLLLWDYAAQVHKHPLKILRNRVLRLIQFKNQLYSSCAIAKDLGFLLLDDLYDKLYIMFMHSVYYKYGATIMTCTFSLTNLAHVCNKTI